jgi:hypothetical protein
MAREDDTGMQRRRLLPRPATLGAAKEVSQVIPCETRAVVSVG